MNTRQQEAQDSSSSWEPIFSIYSCFPGKRVYRKLPPPWEDGSICCNNSYFTAKQKCTYIHIFVYPNHTKLFKDLPASTHWNCPLTPSSLPCPQFHTWEGLDRILWGFSGGGEGDRGGWVCRGRTDQRKGAAFASLHEKAPFHHPQQKPAWVGILSTGCLEVESDRSQIQPGQSPT